MNRNTQGQFTAAKKLGVAAFVLSTISLAVTLLIWLVIVGSLVGTVGDTGPCEYVYYNTYSGRYRKLFHYRQRK